jgi:hypothetical protein
LTQQQQQQRLSMQLLGSRLLLLQTALLPPLTGLASI